MHQTTPCNQLLAVSHSRHHVNPYVVGRFDCHVHFTFVLSVVGRSEIIKRTQRGYANRKLLEPKTTRGVQEAYTRKPGGRGGGKTGRDVLRLLEHWLRHAAQLG
jgi:hypothetical protein